MLRLCSIMGTVVLALAVAVPASASKKKSESASSAAGAKSKGKGKKKDDKKSEAKPDSDAAEEKKELPPPQPDTWEKPPMEQEKPVVLAQPKVVEKAAVTGDGKRWSAGLIAGWAFTTDRRTGGTDPYGLGFGIRGGYHFPFKLYAGLFYMYYLGSSTTGTTAQTNLESTTSANYMHFGVEAGYDWWTGPVIIRPSLEVGPALLIATVDGTNQNQARMLFGPGLSIIYPMEGWFIGGEGRANLVPSSNGVSSVLAAVHVGMRFK